VRNKSGKNTVDSKDAAARVIEIAKLLRVDAERLVALKRFFESGNTQAAADALGRFQEGTAATLITGAILASIAIACTRASDKAAPDRYSIPTAQLLLADAATLEVVAAAGNLPALNDFLRLADEIENAYSHGRLRDLRNCQIAHHLPDKYAKVHRANLQHLWNAVSDVLITVYQLGVGTGITTVAFDSVDKVWTERCDAYWHRLIGGPSSEAK